MAKSKPDLKCAGCGLIGSCYFNEPNQGWYCVEGCEAAKKRGTPEQVIVCEDAPGPCAACHNDTDGEVIDGADYCDSCAISIYREKLAAMQARAEKAERERDAYRRAKAENDERFQIEAQEQRSRAEAAEARIAALEARLAEQAPVVEAAERYCGLLDDNATGTAAALDRLEGAVTALRAARSLRGAGEAARPMASDMIDCPRCGRTHAAYIQGCAVEGGSDATGNGWDARGAGEGGGA